MVSVAVVAEQEQQQQEEVWPSVVTRNLRRVGDVVEVGGWSQEHEQDWRVLLGTSGWLVAAAVAAAVVQRSIRFPVSMDLVVEVLPSPTVVIRI